MFSRGGYQGESPRNKSTPLLLGQATLSESNENLEAQISKLSFTIRRLRKENKALREENERLRSKYEGEHVVEERKAKGRRGYEDIGPNEKTKGRKRDEEDEQRYNTGYGGGYQIESVESKGTSISSSGSLSTEICYHCESKDITARCAGTDCDRRLCRAHCYKMLTNSELFCEECYAVWSNAIPTELSIIAKRVLGAMLDK